jgi:hypothetical protein
MGDDNSLTRLVNDTVARIRHNAANADQNTAIGEIKEPVEDQKIEPPIEFGPLDRIGYLIDAVSRGNKSPVAVQYHATNRRPSSISDRDMEDLDKKLDGPDEHLGEFLQGIHDSAVSAEDPTPFVNIAKVVKDAATDTARAMIDTPIYSNYTNNHDGFERLIDVAGQVVLGTANPWIGFVAKEVFDSDVEGLQQPPETVREASKMAADTALMFMGAREVPGIKVKPVNVNSLAKEAFGNPQELRIAPRGPRLFDEIISWFKRKRKPLKPLEPVPQKMDQEAWIRPAEDAQIIDFDEGRTLKVSDGIRTISDWTIENFKKLLGPMELDYVAETNVAKRVIDLSGISAKAGPVEFGIKGVWGGPIPAADVVAGDGTLIKGPIAIIKGDNGISRSPVSVIYDPNKKIVTVTNHGSQPISVYYGKNEIIHKTLENGGPPIEIAVDQHRPTVTIAQLGKTKLYEHQIVTALEKDAVVQMPKVTPVASPSPAPSPLPTRLVGVPNQEQSFVRPPSPDLDIIPSGSILDALDNLKNRWIARGLNMVSENRGLTREFRVSPTNPSRQIGGITIRTPKEITSNEVADIFAFLRGENGGTIIDPFVPVKNGRAVLPSIELTVNFRRPFEFEQMCNSVNKIRAGRLSQAARERGLISFDSGMQTYHEENALRTANGISGKLFEPDFIDQANHPLPRVVIDIPIGPDMETTKKRLLQNLDEASKAAQEDLGGARDRNLYWKVASLFGIRH